MPIVEYFYNHDPGNPNSLSGFKRILHSLTDRESPVDSTKIIKFEAIGNDQEKNVALRLSVQENEFYPESIFPPNGGAFSTGAAPAKVSIVFNNKINPGSIKLGSIKYNQTDVAANLLTVDEYILNIDVGSIAEYDTTGVKTLEIVSVSDRAGNALSDQGLGIRAISYTIGTASFHDRGEDHPPVVKKQGYLGVLEVSIPRYANVQNRLAAYLNSVGVKYKDVIAQSLVNINQQSLTLYILYFERPIPALDNSFPQYAALVDSGALPTTAMLTFTHQVDLACMTRPGNITANGFDVAGSTTLSADGLSLFVNISSHTVSTGSNSIVVKQVFDRFCNTISTPQIFIGYVADTLGDGGAGGGSAVSGVTGIATDGGINVDGVTNPLISIAGGDTFISTTGAADGLTIHFDETQITHPSAITGLSPDVGVDVIANTTPFVSIAGGDQFITTSGNSITRSIDITFDESKITFPADHVASGVFNSEGIVVSDGAGSVTITGTVNDYVSGIALTGVYIDGTVSVPPGGTGDLNITGFLTTHPAITPVASDSVNEGNTFIQEISFDEFGHASGIASGTVDLGSIGHSTITGSYLGDDHTQYLTTGRGDVLYYRESEVDGFISGITDSLASGTGAGIFYVASGDNVSYFANDAEYAATFIELNDTPASVTSGQIFYASGTDLLALGSGVAGHYLQQGAAFPQWAEVTDPPVISVNGEVGEVLLSGSHIEASHSPTYYTATDTTISGHFSAADTEIGVNAQAIANNTADISVVSGLAAGKDNYQHWIASDGSTSGTVISQEHLIVSGTNDAAVTYASGTNTFIVDSPVRADTELSYVTTGAEASLGNETVLAAGAGLSLAGATFTASGVELGGVSATLGVANPTPAFDLADATNYPSSGLVGEAAASGAFLYSSGTAWVELPAANSGSFLKTQGPNDAPTWFDITPGSIGAAITAHTHSFVDLDDTTPAIVAGDIFYVSGSNVTGLSTGESSTGKFLQQGPDGYIRWDTPAGAGGGISSIIEDTSPQLGGNLSTTGFNIDMGTADKINIGNRDITYTRVGQWNTAFGWRDHGLPSTPQNGDIYIYSGDSISLLPSGDGASKYLRQSTEGYPFWDTVNTEGALPIPSDAGALLYWSGSGWVALEPPNSVDHVLISTGAAATTPYWTGMVEMLTGSWLNSSSLSDIGGVDDDPAAGEVLVYDGSNWTGAATSNFGGGGGGSSILSGLTDVNLTGFSPDGPVQWGVLVYEANQNDSNVWLPITPTALANRFEIGNIGNVSLGVNNIDDTGALLINSGGEWIGLDAANSGYVLETRGTDALPAWVPAGGGGNVDDLSGNFTGHTGDTGIHFTTSQISITESQIDGFGDYATNVYVNDLSGNFTGHTGDASIHFTTGEIDHGNIAGLLDNDHPQYTLTSDFIPHTSDTGIHFTHLTGLTDVSAIPPSQGQVLTFTGGTWRPTNVSGSAGAGASDFIGLSDTPNPIDDGSIYYGTGSTLTGLVTGTDNTGLFLQQGSDGYPSWATASITGLGDIGNVFQTANSANNNNFLRYSTTPGITENQWLASTVSFLELTDVTANNTDTGSILINSGGDWIELDAANSGYVLETRGIDAMPAWVPAGSSSDVDTLSGNFTGHTGNADIHFTTGEISHLNITDIGINTHAQIDNHVIAMTGHTGDTGIHFTTGDIYITESQIVGFGSYATNSYVNDLSGNFTGHTGDASVHFTTGEIDHGNILGLSDNDHPQYTLTSEFIPHTGNADIHLTQGDINHTLITNIGINSHVDIDNHIIAMTGHTGDASIHFTSIAGLADVSTTPATNTQVLTWDNGEWAPADSAAGPATLSGLTDTNLTDPDDGSLLVYSASQSKYVDRFYVNTGGQTPTEYVNLGYDSNSGTALAGIIREDNDTTNTESDTGNQTLYTPIYAPGYQSKPISLDFYVEGLQSLSLLPIEEFSGVFKVYPVEVIGGTHTTGSSIAEFTSLIPAVEDGSIYENSFVSFDPFTGDNLYLSIVFEKQITTSNVAPFTSPWPANAWYHSMRQLKSYYYSITYENKGITELPGGSTANLKSPNPSKSNPTKTYLLKDTIEDQTIASNLILPAGKTLTVTKTPGSTLDAANKTYVDTLGDTKAALVDFNAHAASGTVHFTEGDIDHTAIQNVGSNTHAQIDTHIASTANPHATDIGNLGGGTLAELNTAVTDATLDNSSASRPPNGSAGGDLGGTYPNPTVDDGADGTAIHDNVAAEISSLTEKATPVSADLIIIEDSAALHSKKKVQIGNLPSSGGGSSDLTPAEAFAWFVS